MKALTERDREVLDFIKSYIAEYGYAPSYGEIETDHPGAPRAIRIKGDKR